MNKNLVFVVYDGILNPVFSGQVIQPILTKITENPDLRVFLICFEKDNLSEKIINHYIPNHKNITFIKFKRFPVLGKLTLIHSVYLLKKFLKTLPSYSIKARGPLAGWVSMHAANKKSCESLIVQARGLIVVEYDMFLINPNKLKTIFHNYRKNLFTRIEKEIYNPKKLFNNFFIESITPALSDYLIQKYNTKKENIKIANEDFPEKISEEQKIIWRNEIRQFLGLSEITHIFCYNGSSKPWQSLDLTINFFKERLKENLDVFLLILTQDIKAFEKILSLEKIDPIYYKILTVKHEDIYKYLSACDTGLIFRKPHLANWISRPIKVMEYQAVNLNIVHNNTVKWLIDQYN